MPLVVSESEVGRGYSADDLHRRQLEQLKERLSQVHPTLHVRGVELLCAKLRAEDAVNELREEIVSKLGGEATRESLVLFERDAKAIVEGERARKRVSGNAADLPQASAPKMPARKAS
jgi:hypothetical protein